MKDEGKTAQGTMNPNADNASGSSSNNPHGVTKPSSSFILHPSSFDCPSSFKISGLVLAGGQGSRMGHVDKGLQLFRGKPMVAHVLERFSPQVSEVLINANRNLNDYARFGYRVIPDEVGGFAGPLAGLERGLSQATHPLVATVPCDSPFLPADLVARLAAALHDNAAQLAVAKTFDQSHPVFCLCYASLASHLKAFLVGGGRKIDKWYSTLKVVEVNFDDEEAAFSNINTLEELAQLDIKI